MRRRLSRHFLSVVAIVLATGACTAPPAPSGGVTPAFVDVPRAVDAPLGPRERDAVRGNLQADGIDALVAADGVRARLGRTPQAAMAGGSPLAEPTGTPTPPSVPPAPPLIGREMIAAGNLVALATAALVDRSLLESRLQLLAPAPPSPTSEVATALVFAPDGVRLTPLERARLDAAIARFGIDGDWLVAAHGDPDLAAARVAVVTAALVEAGVPAERIGTVAGARAVDLAEVRVRR